MQTVRNRAVVRRRSNAKPVPALDPLPLAEPDAAPAVKCALPSIESPKAAAKAAKRKSRSAARPAKKRAAPKSAKPPARRRTKAAAKPRRAATVTPAVIALPYLPEPLVAPEPGIDLAAWSALAPPAASAEPVPRARAIVVQRSGGLLEALALWLGSHTRQLWRRFGRPGQPAPQRRASFGLRLRRPLQTDQELQRLRAENERLRLQLEALLVLQTGAGGERAHSPS